LFLSSRNDVADSLFFSLFCKKYIIETRTIIGNKSKNITFMPFFYQVINVTVLRKFRSDFNNLNLFFCSHIKIFKLMCYDLITKF